MPKNLVIVESPTKARTISKFLGKDYTVESSFGHVRDLPKSTLGVDVDHDFTPKYVVPLKAKKLIKNLQALAKKSDMVYFATDEDREGEAISWHLAHLLKVDPMKARRITFHEITKSAVDSALKNPRDIKMNLVDAQQARRVLDRLVGYKLSPFLWKKVAKGLSAGRVQSVAVRLIVEREREIQAFKPEEYWTVEGMFKKPTDAQNFKARLVKVNDKRLEKLEIKNEASAKEILNDLKKDYTIEDIQEKQIKRSPLPPFTTSTLQQEANRKLGFSSKQTMMLAQQLYEGIELGSQGSQGLITYMRTDAFNLAESFLAETKQHIEKAYGSKYALAEPRRYKKKSKLAQEAHEAIRPTSANNTPESVKNYLDDRQYKLYELIWRRAVATQMKEAILKSMYADLACKGKKKYTFRANGLQKVFDGYTKLYPESNGEELLPNLSKSEKVITDSITPLQHFTEPPARYSEAGLVKTLEENGIGRPSTYAPTMSTIVDRGYVVKEERKFKPTEIGILVNDLLTKHFQNIVDIGFTAHMEDDLDEIANGVKPWIPVIQAFYQPFKENLMQKEQEVSKKELTETSTNEVCEKCSKPMIIKLGRFGKFMACSGFPECKNTKQLNGNGEKAEPEVTNEKCDKCGAPMQIKVGRFGKFLGCSAYPECKNIKRIEKKTGVICPECNKGDIVERRSKRGRSFYSCNKYPACKFALWSKPTGEKCPNCGSLIVYAKEGKFACSKKECGFVKE